MQFSQLRKQSQPKPKRGRLCLPDSQQSVRRLVGKQNTNGTAQKWCALTESVVRYISKEMQPFSTVEKPAFQQMLQKSDSQYELYVSQTAIPQLYNSVKEDILKEIKDIPFYSATTDMCSSSNMTPLYELDHTLHNC